MESTKHPGGRPSDYTEEIANKICEELAMGRSLRTICKDEELPSIATIFNWFRTHPEFLEQYTLAKEQSAEADNETLTDIGDEAIQASYTADPKAANAVVSAYKLKADNLKWFMSKKKPKKYGEKMDVTSGGEAIKGNTIVFQDFKDATNSQ